MEVNHSLIELCKCVLESFLIEERPIEYRSQNCISHMLSSQLLYKQDRDFHVTHLYVKNKHGSVRPHVEYIMSGLGTSCLDLLLCCLLLGLHICHVFMSTCCYPDWVAYPEQVYDPPVGLLAPLHVCENDITGSPDAHGCCLAPILPFGLQLDYTLTLFSLMSSPYAA